MNIGEVDQLVQQLTAGFEVLQDEYQKLHGQHRALERKLATAREQYNELAKLYGANATTTPPLSLSSSPGLRQGQAAEAQSITEVLVQKADGASRIAADIVQVANKAASSLRRGLPKEADTSHGVRIWSGPSADRLETGSRTLPSISESPLEQDFTIEGKPSKLGCPFASMANKRLSSHAASVLSRYNNQGSPGTAPSTAISSVSRVNGKESFAQKNNRRSSFVDPIKAEICGLSGHQDEESPHSERALKEHLDQQENAEVGVCPIRFLDQHSPEEVATYFERHKHELPRSHEVCVKRYQTNEKQIRELDAKYGNLVSMIQGLGAKHKGFLPEEPQEEGVEAEGEDGKSAEKVRKWASSVSVQAAVGEDEVEQREEDRQPHFERPLRDIRVGESPSRPWGISIPAKYLENGASHASSKPVQVTSSPLGAVNADHEVDEHPEKAAKCPFGFDKNEKSIRKEVHGAQPSAQAQPAFIAPDAGPVRATGLEEVKENTKDGLGRMVFTGPVFIGYSADDAARIMRESGLGGR